MVRKSRWINSQGVFVLTGEEPNVRQTLPSGGHIIYVELYIQYTIRARGICENIKEERKKEKKNKYRYTMTFFFFLKKVKSYKKVNNIT